MTKPEFMYGINPKYTKLNIPRCKCGGAYQYKRTDKQFMDNLVVEIKCELCDKPLEEK